jgi:hypothetical protein
LAEIDQSLAHQLVTRQIASDLHHGAIVARTPAGTACKRPTRRPGSPPA